MWNIRGLSTTKYVSANPIWKMADIINIVETWEHESNTIGEIPGFTLVGSTWNQRSQRAGRGYGGIATFIRSQFLPLIHLEGQDIGGQYHWLRLGLVGGSYSYLAVCYFAPLSMPIYSTRTCNRSQPFHRLIGDVLNYQSKGEVFLVGDFNARIGCAQFTQVGDLLSSPSFEELEDSMWCRKSSDICTNPLTEHFLIFGATCNLKVLNGISLFPNSLSNTCFSPTGVSTIDYLLSSATHSSFISKFDILEPQPESDHAPLLFTLLLSKTIPLSPYHSVLASPKFRLDPSKKELYMLHFQNLLTHTSWSLDPHTASGQLIELLKDTASKFFLRHKDRRARGLPCNGWFDLDCKQARMRSVDKSLDFQSRLILTRLYKDLVKSKKRAFLRTKQESLTKELMENPKSFWRRLAVRSSKPTLDPKSLIDFAEKLYFFPNAASMPCCEGTSGLFSESEVMTQVRKLANGKSEDLDGLSIELLK